jgi:hypothetical protein
VSLCLSVCLSVCLRAWSTQMIRERNEGMEGRAEPEKTPNRSACK